MSEFTETRLRALLQTLSVTQLSRSQRLCWWLWLGLQCMIAGSLIAPLFLKPTAIQYDETWRQFLLSYPLASFATLASGIYIVAPFAHFGSGMLATGRARRGPPPGVALALRQATYARDPRIAPIALDAQPALDPAIGSAYSSSSLAVAAPDLLAEPLLVTITMLALGAILLWFASVLTPTQFLTYNSLMQFGILLMMSTLAFAYARYCWNSWRAASRGVAVTASVEGLTIRAPETLGGQRFIHWRAARSLARLTYSYSDDESSTHTVYMLDAGDQTLLWECPPDIRNASPARRAKIEQRQSHGARLMALVATTTGLPLLDISEIVNTIAYVEPNLAPIDFSVSDFGGVVAEVSPTTEDLTLLQFLSSAGAETANSDAPSLPSTAGARLEQWRRFLGVLLFWFISLVAAIWFFHLRKLP